MSDRSDRSDRSLRVCASAIVAVALHTLLGTALVASPGEGGREPPREPPAAHEGDSAPAAAGIPGDRLVFEAYWDEGLSYRIGRRFRLLGQGLRFEPRIEEKPQLAGRIGLKLQVDAAAFVERQGVPDIPDQIDIRRFFFYTNGEFFLVVPIFFNLELGVVKDGFYFDQGFLMLKEIPYVGSFKIGQYDAPLSLEALISSRDRTLMESGSPVQAFIPGTRAGIQLGAAVADQRATWALGWFADAQDVDVGDASKSIARVIGRVTWLPLFDAAAETPSLVHVGLGASCLRSATESIRYRSRPESFLAPFAVDTGEIDARHAVNLAVEAAYRRGPLSFQGEYIHALADGGDAGGLDFLGFYATGSWLLTGESRPYRRDAGVFGQVLPHRPFSICDRRWGAWEVAGRYSYVDLADGPIEGGRMHGFTAGLNWYWNRYVRWQFNHVFSIIDDGALDGRLHTFQVRFQLVI
jgi:phosphate-selective porin OprO/OprP